MNSYLEALITYLLWTSGIFCIVECIFYLWGIFLAQKQMQNATATMKLILEKQKRLLESDVPIEEKNLDINFELKNILLEIVSMKHTEINKYRELLNLNLKATFIFFILCAIALKI
jgi:hypothetical protein